MNNKLYLILTLLIALAGCDYAERKDQRNERRDGDYRAAMADYSSGRLDQAIKGFEKVTGKDPANAEARFQLAYLLQDHKKDFAGAYHAYQEFLRQHPQSEKTELVKNRLKVCELELAKQLAEKYHLSEVVSLKRAADEANARCETAEKRVQNLEKDLEALLQRNRSLNAERERLMAMLKGGADESPQPSKLVREAKDLLEEEEEEGDRIRMSEDFAKLKAEEKLETAMSAPSLLPARTEADLAQKAARDEAEQKAKQQQAEFQQRMAHPDTYVVQEGDTLFKIALRFYHRTSEWQRIREANKAIITPDGRIRAGQTIKLP